MKNRRNSFPINKKFQETFVIYYNIMNQTSILEITFFKVINYFEGRKQKKKGKRKKRDRETERQR